MKNAHSNYNKALSLKQITWLVFQVLCEISFSGAVGIIEPAYSSHAGVPYHMNSQLKPSPEQFWQLYQ